jgi:hypothetical protein
MTKAKKQAHRLNSKVERITPKRAAKYLENNPKNRNISPRVSNRYGDFMKNGKWSLTGEPIIFASDGSLLDGQHRLTACITSDTPFETVVLRGVDPSSFSKMNQGRSRTLANVLQAEGVASANRIAAAARNAMIIEEASDVASRAPLSQRSKCDPDDLLAYVHENFNPLQEGLAATRTEQGLTLLRPHSIFIALYCLFAKRNRSRAIKFFEGLTGGEGLRRTDPIFKLRALLISNMNQGVRGSFRKVWMIGVTIKSWNAWLTGKEVKNLRFSVDNEKFPKIRSRA